MGDFVVGGFGWCTHTIIGDNVSEVQKLDPALYKDRESTALGVLGMPGYVNCQFMDDLE